MRVYLAKRLLKIIRRILDGTDYGLINGMIRRRPRFDDKPVY